MKSIFRPQSDDKSEKWKKPLPLVKPTAQPTVVAALAAITIVCAVGSLSLELTDRTTPDFLAYLGSNSLCVLSFYIGGQRKWPPTGQA